MSFDCFDPVICFVLFFPQTVLAAVMGATLWWVIKKVGKPVADMLDERRQVRDSIIFT